MSNTTFSNMSYPDLDLTFEAYEFMMSRTKSRLKEISYDDTRKDERTRLHAQVARLNELMNAIRLIRGCIHQNLNG